MSNKEDVTSQDLYDFSLIFTEQCEVGIGTRMAWDYFKRVIRREAKNDQPGLIVLLNVIETLIEKDLKDE